LLHTFQVLFSLTTPTSS